MGLIKLVKISKRYEMGKLYVEALKDICLEIEKGEFLGLVGPSGSGKTTLLNIMGCLDTTTEGQYIYDGIDISNMKKPDIVNLRREKFGFIFQTFNLIKVLTVYENVEIPLALLGYEKKKAREKIMELLKKVGLDGLENRLPSELSGGQQQRVAIARALIKEPDVIFADEPTANLDHKTGSEIIDLMKILNEQFNTTFIFSTHDPKIMEHAKRLITLEDGRIV